MAWDVEYTDMFGAWWDGLTEKEQGSVDNAIGLLENVGPHLPYPHSSQVKGSKYSRMRELRIQHAGRPFRVCCTSSTHCAPAFFYSVATRPARIAGTQ